MPITPHLTPLLGAIFIAIAPTALVLGTQKQSTHLQPVSQGAPAPQPTPAPHPSETGLTPQKAKPQAKAPAKQDHAFRTLNR